MVPKPGNRRRAGNYLARPDRSRNAPADRPILPGPPGNGQCRQHQRGPETGEESVVNPGHLSFGKQPPGIPTGHGGAWTGIPDIGAGLWNPCHGGFRRGWHESGRHPFEAGDNSTMCCSRVPGSSASHAADPLFFYDIFCRVGGASVGNATGMVTIYCNNVVGDNFWLWRADHGQGVGWTAQMKTSPV